MSEYNWKSEGPGGCDKHNIEHPCGFCITDENKKSVRFLNLYFPHGATVRQCGHIAQNAQRIVKAGVSEGGFIPTNKYGLNVDDVTFSEDSMSYTFGHDRSNPTNERGK